MNNKSMKDEAYKRMAMLGLSKDVIDTFSNGKLLCSDRDCITEVPKNILERIEEWQNKFGNLVYHVVHSEFMNCETYNCLSVSCYKEDWDYERHLICDDWVMCHSINMTFPENTESGSIEVININGILIRVN